MIQLRHFGSHLITSRDSIPNLFQKAILLDRIGFDLLTIGDHNLIPDSQAAYPNAHTILSSIAMLTKKIKLATAVTDPFRRHPAEIAQALATLDEVSGGGRIFLGIGAGEKMNIAPFGIGWNRPLTSLREAIEVIRLLWSASPSNPANYHGRVFSLQSAYLQIRRHVVLPIYIGAAGKSSRELAGELGDGWITPADESIQSLKEHLTDLEHGRKKTRQMREANEIDVVVTVYTSISDDIEKAYRDVEIPAKMQLIQERSVLREFFGIEIPEELSFQHLDASTAKTLGKIKDHVHSIPRKIVEDVVVYGTPDDCIARIENYLRAGASSILICSVSDESELVFKTYQEQIIPYLRTNYTLK